jgi:SAM-dependent methyltransferase
MYQGSTPSHLLTDLVTRSEPAYLAMAMCPPPSRPDVTSRPVFDAIASRERVSDWYWSVKDPINRDRVLWRAQTARHLLHILPGERILELGCGSGQMTRALLAVTRQECPIVAATFDHSADVGALQRSCPSVEIVPLTGFPGELAGRQFDYVIGGNLLDLRNGPGVLREVMTLLRTGGKLLFFESNPWNPLFRIRRLMAGVLPFMRRGDERALPSQRQLYELLSEIGFIGIGSASYDFLYPPIPTWLMSVSRNLSLVLENTPAIRQLAGTILLHGQKPPRPLTRPAVRLTEHKSLHGAVSVVVPCHNEEMNVGPLVDGLLRHFNDYVHELILVDDNSTDRTREVMEALAAYDPRVRLVLRKPPNGVGRALADGIARTTASYVLLMDCDFLHILPELRDLFDAAAEGADAVVGSRFSRKSVLINYPLRKILCNRSFHLLLSLLFRRRLRDLTNNLKLMRREVIQSLELESPWFAANAETGLKPLLMGYDVRSVPVSWINRTPEMGQSSFSLVKSGAGYLKILASLAWRTRFGTRRLSRLPKALVNPVSWPVR